MATKEMKIRITAEEGQQLLKDATALRLPEKLGEKVLFQEIERGATDDEIRELWAELKSRSPRTLTPERPIMFGPADNWQMVPGTEPRDRQFQIADPGLAVEVHLSKRALNGLVWIIILRVFPRNEAVGAGMAGTVYWPVAEKIKKVAAIREFCGLDKAPHREFLDDPEPIEEKKSE